MPTGNKRKGAPGGYTAGGVSTGACVQEDGSLICPYYCQAHLTNVSSTAFYRHHYDNRCRPDDLDADLDGDGGGGAPADEGDSASESQGVGSPGAQQLQEAWEAQGGGRGAGGDDHHEQGADSGGLYDDGDAAHGAVDGGGGGGSDQDEDQHQDQEVEYEEGGDGMWDVDDAVPEEEAPAGGAPAGAEAEQVTFACTTT